MTKKYGTSLFIFRRDHRLTDNIGLIKALEESSEVIPIFIFTPEQLVSNPYKSDNCVQFMVESLVDLNYELKKYNSKLFFFYGKPKDIVNKLLKNVNIDSVYVNQDYSPYSTKRDNGMRDVCDKYDVDFNSYEDQLLNPIGSIRTGSDGVYEKFTPYFRKALKIKVNSVRKNKFTNYCSTRKKIPGQFKGKMSKFYKYNDNIAVNGGRSAGLRRLNNIKKFKKYNTQRNILSIETTRLSAYIRFGNISIREVYHKFKSKLGTRNDLIKQLYWRDFFFNIMYYNPYVADPKSKNKNFKKEYNKIPWIRYKNASDKQKKLWKAWKEGKTGFPVVDAAMREMNIIGFMHNRGRLIVSSFLTKLMMWHWEEGEIYFANTLLDYEISNNSGGWQWSSSSGVDSQPYFRIFNPWSQSEKFDSDAKYIKKWCPELKDVDPKHIHKWDEWWDEYEDIDYPKPILDYKKARENALKKYKKALYG